MAEQQDLYEILGVSREADRDTLQKAYRRLARANHPDLNPDDPAAEERFKAVSLAWEVLSDPDKRRNYDEFGEIALDPSFDPEAARRAREQFGARFGSDGPDPSAFEDGFAFGDIDDLLGRLFGNGSGAPRTFARRGADLEAELDLGFLDAVRGGEQRLVVRRVQPTGGVASEEIRIRIPPGVEEQGRLRIPGKGAPGAGGGPAGDLWVALRVRPHRTFRRDGQDLSLDLPVSVREAIRGAEIEVPTLEGRATLRVPPGTQGGTRLRLRGKGVPAARGKAAGDLLVRVQIRVPKDLDEAALDAVDDLARFEDPSIRDELLS